MSLLSFSEHSPFAKSILRSLNNNSVLKFPENVDDTHYVRFRLVDFPDLKTRITRGPQTQYDPETQLTGPKTFGQSTILLFMPEQVSVSNGQDWETVELGLFGKTAEELAKSSRDLSISNNVLSNLKTAGNVALQAVYNITGFENIKDATSRHILNPFKDVLYKGPQFRTFSFKWTLIPHNEEDCATIKNIMDSFRYHAAPSKIRDFGLSLYGFPGAFEVSFHSYNAAFNQYLPQLGYCVATNVSSNYTAAGLFSAFRNGHTTEVEFSVDMQEIQIITREELRKENSSSMGAQSDSHGGHLTSVPNSESAH